MRIRNIKPEFWTSEDIAGLDWNARLVFIGLWSYVDDNGVGRDVEKLIVSSLFPLEDDIHATRMLITCSLQQLENAGLIARYKVDERSYLEITGWEKHQYIPRPNKPRYPSVTCGNAEMHEPDMNKHVNDMQVAANDVPGSGGQRVRGSEGQVKRSSSTDKPLTFDEFWKSYPRKVGKGHAIKAYKTALKKADHQQIMAGLETLRIQTAGKTQDLIPHAATWLNGERWDDELPAPAQQDIPHVWR